MDDKKPRKKATFTPEAFNEILKEQAGLIPKDPEFVPTRKACVALSHALSDLIIYLKKRKTNG